MTGLVEYIKIESAQPVIDYLSVTISEALVQGKAVLWLMTGGSSINIAVEVSKRLKDMPLKKLHITLTDERYGAVGHADSNWFQLEQAGFNLDEAELHPVLIGETMENTVINYAEQLNKCLNEVNFRIGLFGIGQDGHVAGILPNSPAVNDQALAIGYDASPYRRITITPNVIAQLDQAVVYAVGHKKWPIIMQLDASLPINEQPAQALKTVPKLMIFNDYKGQEN